MSVWCGARGRMERREAFHKLKLRRSGRGCWGGGGGGVWVRHSGDHRQDYKKKKKREGGWNTAQMYEITLWDLIARHSRLQPCRFSQCRILYVFKQSLGWRGDALQLKIRPAISGSLKWVDVIFICLKKKKRRHKNAALAPPQQRGLFGSCNMAQSRYVQIRCAAETIYRLSPSLLKSICNWESLRCPPYCVASPWLLGGFNEK